MTVFSPRSSADGDEQATSRLRECPADNRSVPGYKNGDLCGRPPPRKDFLRCRGPLGRVQTCVRPVEAARTAAGPDAIRESGPYQLRGL